MAINIIMLSLFMAPAGEKAMSMALHAEGGVAYARESWECCNVNTRSHDENLIYELDGQKVSMGRTQVDRARRSSNH